MVYRLETSVTCYFKELKENSLTVLKFPHSLQKIEVTS